MYLDVFRCIYMYVDVYSDVFRCIYMYVDVFSVSVQPFSAIYFETCCQSLKVLKILSVSRGKILHSNSSAEYSWIQPSLEVEASLEGIAVGETRDVEATYVPWSGSSITLATSCDILRHSATFNALL